MKNINNFLYTLKRDYFPIQKVKLANFSEL